MDGESRCARISSGGVDRSDQSQRGDASATRITSPTTSPKYGAAGLVRVSTPAAISTLPPRVWKLPSRFPLRGSMSDRDLPGTTTNPTPTATAHDRTLFAGARGRGAVQWSSSLQWLETRAADPSPPTGAAYDGYTHGIGATIEGGLRSNAASRRVERERQVLGSREGEIDSAGMACATGASFSHAAFKADAALHRGTSAIWTLAPAIRLDVWTGQGTPEVSARLDAGWQRGRTASPPRLAAP